MKTYDVIQGTSEWARLRAGIPTASQFHRIVTPKLALSKQSEMYTLELLAERITGEPTVEYTSTWMDRGSQLEADAVAFYSLQRDCDTEKIGFVTNDNGTIGCSPDRFVGDKGMLEIKIGKPSTQMGYLLQSSAAYEDYKIQAQAQLWIAEREWNDLLAYNPLLPPALYRVERDEKFIDALRNAVTAFSLMLEEQWQVCMARGWVRQNKERPRKYAPLATLEELLKLAGTP